MNFYKKTMLIGIPVLMGVKFYFSGGRGLLEPQIHNNQGGKVILITGGTEGLGFETVKYLAAQGAAKIIIASRNQEKGQAVIKQLNDQFNKDSLNVGQIEFMKLDLSDLNSVQDFIQEFQKRYTSIDTLINNAGIYTGVGTNHQGYEKMFSTNYIAPFYLTTSLLSMIKESKESRIINVSSLAHERAPKGFSFCDSPASMAYFKKLDTTQQLPREQNYILSKLANILFTNSLKKYLEIKNSHIQVYSLHPGIVRTALFNDLPNFKYFYVPLFPLVWLLTKSPYHGALTTINLTTLPSQQLVNGGYYRDCLLYKSSKEANDAQSEVSLWNKTVNLLQQEGYKVEVTLF